MPIQWLGWEPQRQDPFMRVLAMAGPMLGQYLMHRQRLGAAERIAGVRAKGEQAGIEKDMQDDFLDRLADVALSGEEAEAAREFGRSLGIEDERLNIAIKTGAQVGVKEEKEAKPPITAYQEVSLDRYILDPPIDLDTGRPRPGWGRNDVIKRMDIAKGPVYRRKGLDWLDHPDRAEYIRAKVDPIWGKKGVVEERIGGVELPPYAPPLSRGLIDELREQYAPGVPGFQLPEPPTPPPVPEARRGEAMERRVEAVGEKAVGAMPPGLLGTLLDIYGPAVRGVEEKGVPTGIGRGIVGAGTVLNRELAPLSRAIEGLPGIGGWLERPEPFYSLFGGKQPARAPLTDMMGPEGGQMEELKSLARRGSKTAQKALEDMGETWE